MDNQINKNFDEELKKDSAGHFSELLAVFQSLSCHIRNEEILMMRLIRALEVWLLHELGLGNEKKVGRVNALSCKNHFTFELIKDEIKDLIEEQKGLDYGLFDIENNIMDKAIFLFIGVIQEFINKKDIISEKIVNEIIVVTDEENTNKIFEDVINKVDIVILKMKTILVLKKIESYTVLFLKVCEVCLGDIFVCSLLKIEERKYYTVFFKGIIKAQTIDDFTMNRILYVTKILYSKENYTLRDVSCFEETFSMKLLNRLNGYYDQNEDISLNSEIEKYLIYCKKYIDIF